VSVYVDPLRGWGGAKGYHWRVSCHMYADSLDELHAIAKKIGMKATWFQKDERLPHYDLHPSQRKKALALGVIEHTRGEMGTFMRARKIERELIADVNKSIEAFKTGEMLSSVDVVEKNGVLYGSVPNAAPTAYRDAGAITLETIMDSYRQMEELRRQDEESRKHIADHMYVFNGAPWDVIRAAYHLAHSHITPLHPEAFQHFTRLTTEYLQGKINASTEQHST
jgi:hypothetical protein